MKTANRLSSLNRQDFSEIVFLLQDWLTSYGLKKLFSNYCNENWGVNVSEEDIEILFSYLSRAIVKIIFSYLKGAIIEIQYSYLNGAINCFN